MSRRVANLTLDTQADLPPSCLGCVFWEWGPLATPALADRSLEKESWLSRTLLEWGSCGKLGYVGGESAGYVLYAPPAYLAGGNGFPTSPISPDAVLLAAVAVRPPHTGAGLGRALVQAAAEDLAGRGVRAIETYGRVAPGPPGGGECVAPAGFFAAVGFRTVRPHQRYPRLRMELRTGQSWRAELGFALEHLRAPGRRSAPGLPASLVAAG